MLRKLKKIKNETVLVHCPKCKTGFHRSKASLGQVEKCGVCVKEVMMVEGPVVIKVKKPIHRK